MNLDHLPQPADKRIAVRVTRDALRQIRGGSPWLYDGSIESISPPQRERHRSHREEVDPGGEEDAEV